MHRLTFILASFLSSKSSSGPAPGTQVTPEMSKTYGPQPGWFAVNVNVLHGDDWPGRASAPNFGYYGYS
jgi:hypothetical protein